MWGKKKKLRETQSLEKAIALCQEYTQSWSTFFNFFADGFESQKITPEGEGKFFEIMTLLARKQYHLRYFLKDSCPSDEKILGILSDAVSLANLHEMSEADFNKFQHGWHVIFIEFNKSLGRLMQRRALLGGEKKVDAGDKDKPEQRKNGVPAKQPAAIPAPRPAATPAPRPSAVSGPKPAAAAPRPSAAPAPRPGATPAPKPAKQPSRPAG